jgi:DNA-binding GntR family transcriptional regulator
MLQKINRTQTKGEQAYQVIKASIIKNELLPGREVSIDSLANSLGISHTPVREAVARLGNDGLIDYEAHKKLKVSQISADDVAQIYEVRKLLEPYAAANVIAGFSADPDLKPMVRRLLEKAVGLCRGVTEPIDYAAYLQIDADLDEIFIRSTDNALFREVYRLVGERSLRVRTYAEAASNSPPVEMMRQVTEEHVSILEALLEANSDIARARVLQHLGNGERRTLNTLRNKLGM